MGEPHLFIVFGGTGDLMARKLLPALFRLMEQGELSRRTHVLATARSQDFDDDSYRRWIAGQLDNHPDTAKTREWCNQAIHYQSLGQAGLSEFRSLGQRIESLETDHELDGNRIFYLALPPGAFPSTITQLGESGLNRSRGWTRLVVEKPFGSDLESAKKLNELVHTYFDESQIYRIDHYLGKETVQNLLVFRFANPIFESLWNRDRVDSVRITVAEDLGVEGRGSYYDRAGALRDMVQNHLTQLLTLTAMEVPAAFQADEIRHEKVKVLRSISPLTDSDVVLGQYSRGEIGEEEVPGYRQEPDVDENSRTETYAALRLEIANWRWQGVPFYLRTGKRLARRLTRIVVHFRRPPISMFQPFDRCRLHSNALVITMQPDEGFDIFFEVKSPGQGISMETHRLDFRYADAFGPLPEAYETLLLDVLTKDQTLFVRADEVEASWNLYTPLLKRGLPVAEYSAGSWGPPEADELLARKGHRW